MNGLGRAKDDGMAFSPARLQDKGKECRASGPAAGGATPRINSPCALDGAAISAKPLSHE